MIVGPSLLPSIKAESESEPLGADRETTSKSSTEEAPRHRVSSSGDSPSPSKKSTSKRSPKSTATKKDFSTDSPEETDKTDRDDLQTGSKPEVLGAAAKLTTECTDSTGTDSDIEIISQDDMTKL